jgi:histidinol-phosphate aminotransferase
MNILDLVRPNIENLTAYSSARSEHSDISGILLDANENSIGSVLEPALNRYPDPMQVQLKKELAEKNKIRSDKIFVGNGSDEAIDLLIRAFCVPGLDNIVIFPPTYGVYSVFAQIHDVNVIHVPLTGNFAIDTVQYKKKITGNSKITFICNPNNPTGNCFSTRTIEEILNLSEALVVIDEAYIDFCPNASLLARLEKYPNLVILQTLSKAWGMAGARIGMAYASPEIIAILNKIKYPYNINNVTQQLAIKALQNSGTKDRFVSELLEQRTKLVRSLLKLDLVQTIYPSQTNFLLVRFTNAKKVYQHLLQNNIIVRDRSNQIHCEDCLRITVGSKLQNRKLIETLTKLEKQS